jgi:hypothetical protein
VDSLLSPASTEQITLKYVCIGDDAPKEITIGLDASLQALRDAIAKQEDVGEKVAVDLSFAAHPIFVTKETAELSLGQWGFGQDFSEHAYLVLKDPETEKPVGADKTLYVSFREMINDDDHLTATNSESGERRFFSFPEWQPFKSKQSDKAMSNFLSGLYVLSSFLSTNPGDVTRFLGHFARRVKFPPAAVAMSYLIRRKSISSEQKKCLSTALFRYMKKLLPEHRSSCSFSITSESNDSDCFDDDYSVIYWQSV